MLRADLEAEQGTPFLDYPIGAPVPNGSGPHSEVAKRTIHLLNHNEEDWP